MNKIRKSLFLRLFLAFALAIVLVLIIVAVSFKLLFADRTHDLMNRNIVTYVNGMFAENEGALDLRRVQELVNEAPLDVRIVGPNVDWASDPHLPYADQLSLKRDEKSGAWMGNYHHRRALKIDKGAYSFLVIAPKMRMFFSNSVIHLIVLGIIFLVLVLAYLTVKWLFGPIERIRTGVERIGRGEFEHRIVVCRQDELADLAHAINSMAQDIQGMLEAKRQLLLAMGHELRSPLTRARVALEMLNESSMKESLRDDLNEMEHIVNDLLEIERMNTRHASLQRGPSSLNDLLRDVINLHFKDQSVVLEGERVDDVSLDPYRIQFVMKNVIENALRYSSSPVRVVIQRTDSHVSFAVIDLGEGIAPEHLPHVTDAFYRVDPSRQKMTGGFGLGLHLCRLIAEAHGGNLCIQSEVGKGTCVSVAIPINGPSV